MDLRLPRILSPNLGCPIIVSPKDFMQEGVDVVIAEPVDSPRREYVLVAKPSYMGDGHKFDLLLEDGHELKDSVLPRSFDRVEQTRSLISTVFKTSIFEGKARFVRFSAKPVANLLDQQLRTVSSEPRITLYNLALKMGAEELFTVFHAVALRPAQGALRFIHATDLHVALRNDIYDATLRIGEKNLDAVSSSRFVNFNKNMRRFIQHANGLADRGQLDFVLMLGDLVDFVEHNYSDRDDYGENNWRLLCDILTGTGSSTANLGGNSGIKVPVFTSTGNHDWRFFPYPPKVNASAYGLDKKSAKALDPFWADDPEELTKKTKEFYKKMIGEGALLSNIMLGGTYLHRLANLLPKLRDKLKERLPSGKVRGNLLDWLLPRMATWQVQVLAPLIASGLAAIGLSLKSLSVVIPAVSGLMNGIIGFVKFLVRWKSPELMALEAGWKALKDYFLHINPYFNYAFQIDRNYFLILDTGFDCLRAQRFWDGGRKKLGRISLKDNILGGSPDSMSFYGANEFYPYSQIAWMEGLIGFISHVEGKSNGPAHIFIGLHTPPINLSKKQRREADSLLQSQQNILLEHGKYDVRYGTINHYLSQFLHLCLGRSERRPEDSFRCVTMVLAGHAHWRMECCLSWDDKVKKPIVYYGNYTGKADAIQNYLEQLGPMILQTPAIGPKGDDTFSQNPPHFRWIEINEDGTVQDARVMNP